VEKSDSVSISKSEQELKEGQLALAKDGTHIAEGNRCIQDFHD
jgi:hypothetical protein